MREQKEARNFYWVMLGFALAITLKMVYEAFMTAYKGGVEHPVAYFIGEYANEGRVLFDGLEPGAMWLFVIGYACIFVGIIVGVFAITSMARKLYVGEFFTPGNLRAFKFLLGGLLGYFLGEFIQNMGANFAASQYGADLWFDVWRGNSSNTMVLCLFLLCITFQSFGIRRGIKMQEEQEGLV